MMRKLKIIICFMLTVVLFGCSCNSTKLPKPEITTGIRGEQFGVDKNINEDTLDEYLNRDDVVYRDMRMLVDPATYGNIGGDSYLSGFVKGFEVVPYPYLAPTVGLPPEVGEGYTGPTLFRIENNEYIANYEESMDILEYLFPKDKAIFLMCGGAGYAGMTKTMLLSLGWDADKVYNVGGHWYYHGENNIEVKRVDEDNQVHYDFYKVAYHDIDFSVLTEVNE